MSVFGDRLKLLRGEIEGLTQEKLGECFKVAKGTVSNWENGNRFPDDKTLVKLADYFDVTTDFLLGRTDIRKYIQLTIDDFLDVGSEHESIIKEEELEYIGLIEEIKDKEIPPEVIKETIKLILKYRHLNKDSHN